MYMKRPSLIFGRRATDDTLVAFHHACDANELQIAGDLLVALEDKLKPCLERGSVQGEHLRALLQAQARLWSLRCRSFGDSEEPANVQLRGIGFAQPSTSKLTNWLAAWLHSPRGRFTAAGEFPIRR